MKKKKHLIMSPNIFDFFFRISLIIITQSLLKVATLFINIKDEKKTLNYVSQYFSIFFSHKPNYYNSKFTKSSYPIYQH